LVSRACRSSFRSFWRATPEAREAYRLREEKAFGDLDALWNASPELIRNVNERLAALAALLHERNEVGISDIKLWPVLRTLSIVRGLNFPEPVRTYVSRLARQSGVPLLFDQQA